MVDPSADTVASATPAAEPATGTVGDWRFEVTVEPAHVGPVAIEVVTLNRDDASGRNGTNRFGSHAVRFTNTGGRLLTIANSRTSALAGNPRGERLVIADEGCGSWTDGPGHPLHAGACRTYLDQLLLEPGESERRKLSLSYGAGGMDPVEPGTYVFERPFRVGIGSRGNPDFKPDHAAELEFSYKLVPG